MAYEALYCVLSDRAYIRTRLLKRLKRRPNLPGIAGEGGSYRDCISDSGILFLFLQGFMCVVNLFTKLQRYFGF